VTFLKVLPVNEEIFRFWIIVRFTKGFYFYGFSIQWVHNSYLVQIHFSSMWCDLRRFICALSSFSEKENISYHLKTVETTFMIQNTLLCMTRKASFFTEPQFDMWKATILFSPFHYLVCCYFQLSFEHDQNVLFGWSCTSFGKQQLFRVKAGCCSSVIVES
jgi:hypothetical protein